MRQYPPTPGPWKVNSGMVETEDGRPIAYMDRTDKATEAGIYPVERDSNAHLIAAAPAMLKALDECLDALQSPEAQKVLAFTMERAHAITAIGLARGAYGSGTV